MPAVPPPSGPPPTSPLPSPPPAPTSTTSPSPAPARSMSSPKEAASTALPPTKTTGSPATAKAGALPATTRANGKAAPAKGKEADPAAYADLVQARINALEGVESAEDQAEKKSAIDARKSVKDVDHASLEVKYMDLFQEMKRQERLHIQERSRFTKEKEAAKQNLTKVTQGKTKLDSTVKDLTRHMKSLQDENKKLNDLVATARLEIDSIKQEVASVRSRPGRPFPLPTPVSSVSAQQPATITASSSTSSQGALSNPAASTPTLITLRMLSIKYGEVFVKVPRTIPLERAFQHFAMAVAPPPASAASTSTHNNGKGKGKQQQKAAAAPPPAVDLPSFVFSHAGKVLEKESTPDELGLEQRDEIWAVEFKNLVFPWDENEDEKTEAEVKAVEADSAADWLPPTVTGAGKKKKKGGASAAGTVAPSVATASSVASLPTGEGDSSGMSPEEKAEAKKQLESIFENVIRERLKTVLRQYELRETQFEAVLRSKELEVLLSKARSEEARWLVEEAEQKSRERENQTERYAKSLEELQRAQGQLLDKLVSLAQDDADSQDQAARLFGFIREEIKKRRMLTPEEGGPPQGQGQGQAV